MKELEARLVSFEKLFRTLLEMTLLFNFGQIPEFPEENDKSFKVIIYCSMSQQTKGTRTNLRKLIEAFTRLTTIFLRVMLVLFFFYSGILFLDYLIFILFIFLISL